MKNSKLIRFMFVLLMPALLVSCKKENNNANVFSEMSKLDYANLETKAFEELFKEVKIEDVQLNPFTLFPQINGVLTSGKSDKFNSMVVGDGALGQLISKPVAIVGLRGNRYTLEIIQKEKKYTISFFDEQFRKDFMEFGMRSGKDSDKMSATKLNKIATPSGKMTYREAFMIIECDLAQAQTVTMDEVFNKDSKEFYEEAYDSVGSYHKIVVGNISHIWVRK